MSAVVEKIDPMKVIKLAEVESRTGFRRKAIKRRLAEDARHKTPGVNFPAPLRRNNDKEPMKWREITVLKWLEQQELYA